MDTNKIFIDMAQRAHEFAEMCRLMQKIPDMPLTAEVKDALDEYAKRLGLPKADPEAWREEYRKKQAAGVRFENYDGSFWWGMWCTFNGNKEDYREVPQEVQNECDIRIPEASREVLKQWQRSRLKFTYDGSSTEGGLIFDRDSDRYSIPKQPTPSGMSVEAVEAMWRQGLMLEFDGNFGWDLAADGFDWNGIYRGAQLIARLRIPAQPIPEKLLDVPQEVSGKEYARAALDHIAKTYSADKGTAQLNPPTPHAAERALWKAQREAGTNEVWTSTLVKNGATCEIQVDVEPNWVPGCVYRVKPMKLTAKIARREVYKTPYDWEFTGTREEYRAECEKYGYSVVSEIKEVVEKPKTVKYYLCLIKSADCSVPCSHTDHNKERLLQFVANHNYTIIGDIEEREIEA